MTILKHRKRPDGSFYLAVHLDETKKTGDGQPAPEWVREFEWAPKPANMTVADYVAMQLRETKALLLAESAAGVGTKLPSEGTEL